MSKKITKKLQRYCFFSTWLQCISPHLHGFVENFTTRGNIDQMCSRSGKCTKKSDTQACHSECLHNGIILIVYILQNTNTRTPMCACVYYMVSSNPFLALRHHPKLCPLKIGEKSQKRKEMRYCFNIFLGQCKFCTYQGFV